MNKLTGLILAGGMLLLSSQAATIDWTTNAITGLETDVINTGQGTLEAINGAHSGVTTNLTINGVTFTSDGSLLGGNWNGDPWTNTTAVGDYDILLSSIDFEASGTDAFTIKTFPGLTVDGEYLIQYWYADANWQVPDPDRTLTFDGTGTNTIDGLSYAVGTFTADATTQDLIVTASHNGPRLTAYQLRAISGHVEPDPIIDLSVSNLNFGITYVGYTNSMTVTVKNVGGEVLDGTASVPAPFIIESGATYSLSNNQMQVVTVLFAPQAVGEVTNTLSFTGGGGATIPVSGMGEPEPEPSLWLSASNLIFSTTPLGSTNNLSVTVRNDGGGMLEGTASIVAGAPFTIESGADYSLGLGEEQVVVILFAPEAEGEFSDTLSFTGGGGSTIPVSGTGKLILGSVLADIAYDYTTAPGYVGDSTAPTAPPTGWEYLYSTAPTNGTEMALTPQSGVGNAGNSGFEGPSANSTPAVLGGIAGGSAYEIFTDGSAAHAAVVGTDLLLHPGNDAATAYVVARYTFSEADIAVGSVVSISGSFRDLAGGTGGGGANSITADIFHNATSLFSTNGAAGRLFEADGTFSISDLTIAAGDTISFVVGNNGGYGGDETALTGRIEVQSISPPVLLPGVEVVGGNIEFQFTGTAGYHYQVESTEQLSAPDWQPVLDINPLTLSPVDVSIPATDPVAFYRIKYVP